MQKTKCIWFDGQQVSWDEAKIHVLSHTLHYGGGAFEGIRYYNGTDGCFIFRLREHIERLLYSCQVIKMKVDYTFEEIESAVIDTVRQNQLKEGYIRILAFWGAGNLKIMANDLPTHLIVACWAMGKYLASDCVDVKISDFIRIHPKSTVADAKLCGHYLNSIVASMAIKNTKYHESLLLDYQGNIAEGPGENFFCVIDGILHTPSLGNILPGITRSTILEIAQDLSIESREGAISVAKAQSATEAFFSGTAAEVTPIRSIDDVVIGKGKMGSVTNLIQAAYFDAIKGRSKHYERYLTFVE